MRFTRREILIAGAATALLPRLARGEAGALSAAARAALGTSPLVYVTALKRDGSESRCHAEVWFVRDGDSALVVTGAKAWRAAAIGKGLTRARLWVGDHGVWNPADSSYQASPSFLADASLETTSAQHDHALTLFGSKYTREWGSWGPRFKNGLADGSRVLIRYRATSA
ncbi:MAG: hypothetical protein FJ091_21385 [Deltaproteobacteria bacterium]|nr:hypothetical protein [Deltaproteobacteria bacterium]